jgi:hypothetical protein
MPIRVRIRTLPFNLMRIRNTCGWNYYGVIDGFFVAVLAWKLEAEEMCRFTRQEFLTGCRAMKVTVRTSVSDPDSIGFLGPSP